MKLLYLILFFISINIYAQSTDERIQTIKQQLEVSIQNAPGLNELVKSTLNTSQITLSNYLIALSEIHNINMNVSKELDQIQLVKNFTDINVKDLLLFLCKEYNLTIDFTGSILSIKKFNKKQDALDKQQIQYNPVSKLITLDLKSNKLFEVVKNIIDLSGQNLVFEPGIENKLITIYIQEVPFETALSKLAFANDLIIEKTKDGFFQIKSNQSTEKNKISYSRSHNSNLNFEILDIENKLLNVDVDQISTQEIVESICNELKIDYFTATPLDQNNLISVKTDSIRFDDLLRSIFSTQKIIKKSEPNINRSTNFNNSTTQSPKVERYTFKKEGKVYYFGSQNQLSLRNIEVVPLYHRSIELLTNSNNNLNNSNSNVSQNNRSNYNDFDNSYNQSNLTNNGPQRNEYNSNNTPFNAETQTLLKILPNEITSDLEINVDLELNSFYVNGANDDVLRFKNFIRSIDKPVPVVLIEVILLEVNKNATIETGFDFGITKDSISTKGSLFPVTDLTLSPTAINKVFGGFDGFGTFNLGKVVPNFYATIKAMETNGNIKIRSTPKLSTLNGHRAVFSNGQTSYYAVTQRNIYGTNNPQTSEIKNYEPIDAQLGLSIKPLVSGDGQVTLDIFVIQSNFGQRIENAAPPDINSREFSSIIRVKDQDIVVLGGLEEQIMNDSGNGVPLLSKIPLLKWLFSSRSRLDSKAKLTVLIKPTIIY